jgi:hypothetical protein
LMADVRFAAGLTVLVRLAAGLMADVRFAAGLTVLVRFAAGFTAVVRLAADVLRVVAVLRVREVAEAARRLVAFFAAVRAVVVDVRVLVAAEVRLAAGLAELFAVLLPAGRVVLFAVRLVVVRVAFAVRFAVLGAATVVSSMFALTALRRTDRTPMRAAALEPYACDVATSWPLGACRVNRNLPALSLLRVNFAGTNASRCGAVARCGRRWAPIEHWSARRDPFGRHRPELDAFE